jgi:hypothetical protein
MELPRHMMEMRDEGLLITQTRDNTGLTCPAGHKLVKCNLDEVVAMEWDPIGNWEPTLNQVLKLTSKECRVVFYKTNGMKVGIDFQEGDFRYQIDNWLVMYPTKNMRVEKI